MYVWTEKAERRAKECNLEERKAGTLAKFGGRDLIGPEARDWLEKGYVEWRDEGGNEN